MLTLQADTFKSLQRVVIVSSFEKNHIFVSVSYGNLNFKVDLPHINGNMPSVFN